MTIQRLDSTDPFPRGQSDVLCEWPLKEDYLYFCGSKVPNSPRMGIFKGWYISLSILRVLLIISQNNYQQISLKYSIYFTKTKYNKNSIKLEYIRNRCKLPWEANFSKIINPLYHLLRG